MASNFCVSAPGKIILHGEHSVVHGRKAMACAIGSRITITATSTTNHGSITIHMPSLHPDQVTVCIKDFKNACKQLDDSSDDAISCIEKYCDRELDAIYNDFMCLAMSCLLYAYYKVFHTFPPSDSPAVSLSVESQLPIGAGLGSSAAFNTCIACVFLVIAGEVCIPNNNCDFQPLGNQDELNKINSLAFEMEKIVHETPSGIDNSIATFGGAVSFQRGVITRIQKMPKLRLLIVDTQVPRSTKTLVSGVREFLDKCPNVVNPILDAMHNITIAAEDLLQANHNHPDQEQFLNDFGKLIMTNQCLLSSIGVSHPTLDKVCNVARKYGYPGKLTGAGGGGCAIILLNRKDKNETELSQLKEELVNEGFICREADLGGPGILLKAAS